MKTRHFLDLSDFSGAEIRHLLNIGLEIKSKRRRGGVSRIRHHSLP